MRNTNKCSLDGQFTDINEYILYLFVSEPLLLARYGKFTASIGEGVYRYITLLA